MGKQLCIRAGNTSGESNLAKVFYKFCLLCAIISSICLIRLSFSSFLRIHNAYVYIYGLLCSAALDNTYDTAWMTLRYMEQES